MLINFRKNYPITQHDIYLNHAATTPISHKAIARMQEIAGQMQQPLSEHFYPWLGIIEETRRLLAELINAHPTEIHFCQNTSSALSLIALTIPWNPGDKVLAPYDEFPSNIYVWQNLKAKGVEFEFFKCQPDTPVIETLKKIDLDKVRLISISAVSYLTGRHYELKKIADFCRSQNIYSCFDAIQAIGATPFDVKHIGADFVASGAQKWLLGSIGTGFVYTRKEILDNLLVPFVGWTSVKYPEDFSLKELDLSPDATRFEPGLPNILPLAALNQSLRDLNEIGWPFIFQHIKDNALYLTQALAESDIKAMAKSEQLAGIVSITIPPKLDLTRFTKYCKKYAIHLTQRDNYLRISPHFYNTKDELDILLKGLEITAKNIFPIQKEESISANITKHILLTGSTGTLGNAFAELLAAKGYHLTLISRDEQKLKSQADKLRAAYSIPITIIQADLKDENNIELLLQKLRSTQQYFDALINCAGIAEADEFLNLTAQQLQTMFSVNLFAPALFIKAFLQDLKSPQAQGVLNIVSATGRISYPLLSAYGASNAALWSLGESLALELSQESLTITTYVAPAMHSKMQKRLGRVALRYFKTDGNFPFGYPKQVAQEAWQAFENNQTLFISKANRFRFWINAIFPNLIRKRIRDAWKQ